MKRTIYILFAAVLLLSCGAREIKDAGKAGQRIVRKCLKTCKFFGEIIWNLPPPLNLQKTA